MVNILKINIFGASGSGVTTFGESLSKKINIPYFDSDNYYWKNTNIPYTENYSPEIRNKMLSNDLEHNKSCIVGGTITNWDKNYLKIFNLAIFLWIPPEIRIKRLKDREYKRFGEKNFTDELRSKQYKEFLEWAMGYDDNTSDIKNIEIHEKLFQELPCEKLDIRGDLTNNERLVIVLDKLDKLKTN